MTMEDIINVLIRYDSFHHEIHGADHDLAGVCVSDKKKIILDPRQGDREMAHTIVHEFYHALEDIKYKKTYKERDIEKMAKYMVNKIYGKK